MNRFFCLTVAVLLMLAGQAARAQGESVIALPFSAFFKHPIGPRGVEPSAALLAAQGREVRLTGFMVQQERPLAGRFLFTPRPLSMSEHADGDADDLPAHTVTVMLPPGQQDRLVSHRAGPLTLTGRLEWGAAVDGVGRVSWLRLHLPPEALAASAARHPLPHTH